MDRQQDLAQHGLRKLSGGAVIDLSEHIPTGARYIIKWSADTGHMLAIHGPLTREDVPLGAIDHLDWSVDRTLDWGHVQQWRELEILKEESS